MLKGLTIFISACFFIILILFYTTAVGVIFQVGSLFVNAVSFLCCLAFLIIGFRLTKFLNVTYSLNNVHQTSNRKEDQKTFKRLTTCVICILIYYKIRKLLTITEISQNSNNYD